MTIKVIVIALSAIVATSFLIAIAEQMFGKFDDTDIEELSKLHTLPAKRGNKKENQ